MTRFHVAGWAAWAPGYETEASWRTRIAGLDREPAAEPLASGGGTAVPLLLRRRVTPIGQQALRAAWSLPDAARARYIFCSRDGEFSRTLAILDALDRTGSVSPAEFTLSVHNALAGLLSIAHRNRAGHTTLAAGADSLGAGLQEAIGCLTENPAEPVVLVHFHEPLPPPHDVFDDATEPFVLALTLTADGADPIRLTTRPRDPDGATGEPPGLAFVRFLLSGANTADVPGDRQIWQFRRADATA